MRRTAGGALVLVGLWAGAAGAGAPQSQFEYQKALYEQMGIRNDLARSLGYADIALTAYASVLSPGRQQVLRESLHKAFDLPSLEQEFTEDFQTAVSTGVAKTVLTYFTEDPVGRKVAQLDALVEADPKKMADIEIAADRISSTVQDPRRVELLKRIDRSGGVSDHLMSLALLACEAVANGMDAMQPMERQMGFRAIEKYFGSFRTKVREAASRRVLARNLYAYGPLSNDELEHYLQFLEKQPVRAYRNRANQLVQAALSRAAERIGAHVVEGLGAQAVAVAQAEASSGGRQSPRGSRPMPERPPRRERSPRPERPQRVNPKAREGARAEPRRPLMEARARACR